MWGGGYFQVDECPKGQTPLVWGVGTPQDDLVGAQIY